MDTLTCRSCRDEVPRSALQSWTVHEDDSDNDAGIAVLRVTCLCDPCLESDGPDAFCTVPEEQDEAYARAEAEYRELEGSEL